MSTLEFVSSVIDAVAWPAAVVGIVLILRRPLAGLLELPLKRLKIGPTGIDLWWDQGATQVATVLAGSADADQGTPPRSELPVAGAFAQEMLELAKRSSPIAAVLACHEQIGRELRAMLDEAGISAPDALSLSQLGYLALEHRLISASSANAVDGLVIMHNLALLDEGGQRLDLDKALEYIGLTEALLYAMRQPPKANSG